MPTHKRSTPGSSNAGRAEVLADLTADAAIVDLDSGGDHFPDPVKPIPITAAKRGTAFVSVPPKSATEPARKHLRNLSAAGDIALGAKARELLLAAAVFPEELGRTAPARIRVASGWLLTYEARLFTPMLTVAVSNDRWVAHAAYDADPATDRRLGLTAVPLPHSYGDEAALVYESDELSDLIAAADKNGAEVIRANPQDVGRRLIEQPLTLVPTYLRGTARGLDAELLALSAVDGNSRLAAAQANLRVRPDWLPPDRRTTLGDVSRSGDARLTSTVLANLTVEERRTLVRRIAKAAEERLAAPEKATRSDRAERDAAAKMLNSLTAPAKVIVGYVDDADEVRGLDHFHTAVRTLLVQMNVEAKPLAPESRTAVQAEQIVAEMLTKALISADSATALIGRTGVAKAMRNLGLSPQLRDLRAALVLHEFTRSDKEFAGILRKHRQKRASAAERSVPAAELALRSFTGGMDENRRNSVRAAVDKGIIWQELIDVNWRLIDVRTDADVDVLRDRALDELCGRAADRGPRQLLGVLGMFALLCSGHLLAAGGSAEQTVGDRIERGPVRAVISKLLDKEMGVRLFAEAVKAVRAGRRPLWIDEESGEPVDKPDWNGGTFSAHLRWVAKSEEKMPATVPVSARQRRIWTTVAERVSDTRDKLVELRNFRQDNGIDTKLAWVDVEDTLGQLRKIQKTIEVISEPEPLHGEADLL